MRDREANIGQLKGGAHFRLIWVALAIRSLPRKPLHGPAVIGLQSPLRRKRNHDQLRSADIGVILRIVHDLDVQEEYLKTMSIPSQTLVRAHFPERYR